MIFNRLLSRFKNISNLKQINLLKNKNNLLSTQPSCEVPCKGGIRALDSKFKICSKKLTNFRICYNVHKLLILLSRVSKKTRYILGFALLLLAGIMVIYLKAKRIHLISDDYVDLIDLSDWGFVVNRNSFFRPVIQAYFEFLKPFFGMSPVGYHFLSQMIHWFNALLVFFLCRLFIRYKNQGDNESAQSKEFFVPAALALAFACSYAHSEAVFWIAATTTLLEALFILLTMYTYSLYVTGGKKTYLLLSLLLFIIGLGAKEGVFLIVALVPLTYYIFEFRWPEKKAIFSWLAYWAIGLIYLLIANRVVDKALHGGGYAFKIGISLFKNIQQFIFSSLLWTPFNDESLFHLQAKLLGLAKMPPPATSPLPWLWLALGLLCTAFLFYLFWKGGFHTRIAMLMLLIAALPYSLPPKHISGWLVFPYPLRVYYVVIIFYVLLLAVFIRSFAPWRTRLATSLIVSLLTIAAIINGVRVFQRADEWISEGKKYTAILKKMEKRMANVKTPQLLIKVVDNTDNKGIFIRYYFALYPTYKKRLRFDEQKFHSGQGALNFSNSEKRRLAAGDLTIFVYNEGALRVFKKPDPIH